MGTQVRVGDMVFCTRLGSRDFVVLDTKGEGSMRELKIRLPNTGAEGVWIYEAHCSVDAKTAIANGKARKARADQIGRK